MINTGNDYFTKGTESKIVVETSVMVHRSKNNLCGCLSRRKSSLFVCLSIYGTTQLYFLLVIVTKEFLILKGEDNSKLFLFLNHVADSYEVKGESLAQNSIFEWHIFNFYKRFVFNCYAHLMKLKSNL